MAKKGENKTRKSSTLEIITSISAALVLGWLVLGTQANQTSAQQSNFQGGAGFAPAGTHIPGASC